MTEHPTLPFAPHKLARASNPETSKAAARACRELRGEQHERILEVLMLGRGHPPMTACEIAVNCQDLGIELDKHQVGRRLGELLAAGYIEVADEDGVTDTGRKARRYRLAKAAP